MAAIVEFSGLHYTHPGASAPVIRNVSMSIEKGRFVAVVGGSGVGKTTLLRIAAGLVKPSGGVVRLTGETRPDARKSGFVFQDSRLMPWRTLNDNVGYGLEGLALGPKEKKRRIDEVLELTGLAQLGDRWPHELSGGQAQRVGIARALAVKPNLLLMDEPFSAVDAITRRHLQAELVQIWQRSGAAVLFVTHDIEEAVFLADEVIVLGGHPANIVGQYQVELARPRDWSAPEFGKLVAMISHTLEHGG
jgi:NitT/TauT family transport system ATP-binding protein